MLPLAVEGDVDYAGLFKWSIVLIALVLAAWIAVVQIRKRLKEDDITTGTGFTLADLRDLHRSGKMTAEEYEKAKALLLASMAKPTKTQTETKPPTDQLL